MTWRGSTTTWDRVFACLVYLLPLIYAYPYAQQALLPQIPPALQVIFLPLAIVASLYYTIIGPIPFGSLILLIVLLAAVVRNERIRHFVRFNTMQAILVGIALSIFSLLWDLLLTVIPGLSGVGILTLTIFNVLFLGTLAIAVYAIVQSARGRYAEIPPLSDAVYMQVR
ncbi:MAG: Tic20 family protein [Synechococcales bacterium]|nr:Tic20 family protein [Synechococcales bacterium]